MAKAEWGTKRQCPKCGTRFYDLGKASPIICIDCEHKFKPELILKSKMASLELIVDEKPDDAEEELLEDTSNEDIEVDDNTVVLSDDDDTNVAAVVVKPAPGNSDE